jgi:hypothetical protein
MPVSLFSRYRHLPMQAIIHPRRGRTRSLPIRRAALPPRPLNQGRLHRFGAYDGADLLALKHFSREELYWHILDANDHRLPDSFEPGERLVIPPLTLATQVERR